MNRRDSPCFGFASLPASVYPCLMRPILVLMLLLCSCALPHARFPESGACSDPPCVLLSCSDESCLADASPLSEASALTDVASDSFEASSRDSSGDEAASEASVYDAPAPDVSSDTAADASDAAFAIADAFSRDAEDGSSRDARDTSAPYPPYWGCQTNADCVGPSICTSFADGRFKACSPPCARDSDCPSYPGSALVAPTCVTSRGRCALTCPRPGACPLGVECNLYPSGSYGYCS